MPRLALRFKGSVDHVLPLLDRYAGRYLATRENVGDENEHVHVFLDTDADKRAVRKFIQRTGHWTGNAGYSIKACEDDYAGFLDYICKGDSASVEPVVLGYQGFTADQIKEFHGNYYVTADSLAEARRKRKRLTNTTVVEEVLEQARNSGLRWTDDAGIARIYINKYVSAMKGINEFHAASVVRTVKCLLDPAGDAVENQVSAIVGRL